MRFVVKACLAILGFGVGDLYAARIIQVEQVLQLENGTSSFSDYVIDQGTDSGFQPGTWLDVYRRRVVSDMVTYSETPDLRIWVGQVEVIHSQKDLAVARIRGVANPHDQPLLEYPLPQVGDYVEIGKPRKSNSLRSERVPGMVHVSRNAKKHYLAPDAKRYLAKVTQYLRKHAQSLETVDLVGSSQEIANPIAYQIRQSLAKASPPIRFIKSKSGSIPRDHVVILVKRN